MNACVLIAFIWSGSGADGTWFKEVRTPDLPELLTFLRERLLGFRQLALAGSPEQFMPLGVAALPIPALDLDPMTALATRVARWPGAWKRRPRTRIGCNGRRGPRRLETSPPV
jgi:hypothetical protein